MKRSIVLIMGVLVFFSFSMFYAGCGGSNEETAQRASFTEDDDDSGSGNIPNPPTPEPDDDTSVDDDDTVTDDDDDDTTPCTGCEIDGVCYNDGQTNPINACEICSVGVQTADWTENNGASCEDGLYCNGVDTCVGAICEHAGGLCPDDGLWCNGVETCDEETDQCAAADVPNCADDGLWCNGAEFCNEETDACEVNNPQPCPSDGQYCNGEEYCNEDADVCDHQNVPECPDDGNYCNGVETCSNTQGSCVSVSPPECPDDGEYCNGTEFCDEDTDACDHQFPPSCPDDGEWCNGEEACDESIDDCGHQNAPDCSDDGLFCTGIEYCDEVLNACATSSVPNCEDDGLYCNGEEFCNDEIDDCDHRNAPECPDDAVYCNGEEICIEATDSCGHGEAPCGSDDIFCNGDESCNETTDQCDHSGNPCDSPLICNENIDECATECLECLIEEICYGDFQVNPYNECEICNVSISTTDWTNDDGVACEDGLYCNGDDTCQGGACSVHDGDPCPDDGLFCNGEETCDEEAGQCEVLNVPDCQDDGLWCTGQEYCDEINDECSNRFVPNCPDDGLFCTGSEYCEEDTDQCDNSGDPCGSGFVCNESTNNCDPVGDDDDDDDNDDDTTPGGPTVTIIDPEDGEVFSTYLFDIYAEMVDVDSVDNVTVLLDGVDITSTLAVTTTVVQGTVNADNGGEHTLRVEATNDIGLGYDEAIFSIDKPWVRVYAPLVGDSLFSRTVEIDADYGNCVSCEVSVTLDDVDISGELDIWNGSIAGTAAGVEEGEHELVFLAEEPGSGEFAQVTVPFTVELQDPHYVLSASAYTINAGEYVDLTYIFYDENGMDITALVTTDINVTPGDGVVINGNRLTFNYPGLFEVEVGTAYPGYGYITATTWIYVLATQPWDLVLVLSDYEIDAGDVILADATVTDEYGHELDWVAVGYEVDPPFGVTIVEDMITLTQAGVSTVTALVPGTGVYDSKEVTVNPGEPIELILYCDKPIVNTYDVEDPNPDDIVTCAVELRDAYGNAVEDEPYTYSVTPTGGATILGDQFYFEYSDYYVIKATSVNHPSLTDTFMVQSTNSDPPGVVITAPDRALYTQETTVELTGYVYNVNLLDPDTTVYLTQGNSTHAIYFNWQTGDFGPEQIVLINGMNLLQVEVIVNEGSGAPLEQSAKAATSVLYAQYEWPNDSLIENAIGFRIDDLGFDQIEMIISSYLATIPIEEMLMAMNPIFDERVELWGVTLASAKATLTDVTFDQPVVMLDALPDALVTQALLSYIRLDFNVRGAIIGIGYSISGYIEIGNIFLDSFSWISLDSATHEILFDMDEMSVSLGSFNMHIDGFPDELTNWFEHTVEDLVQTTVQTTLENEIPPLIEDLLADIPLHFAFPVGDANFLFDGQPETLTLTGSGMGLWMNGSVQSDTINPAIRPLNGSIRTPSTLPDLSVVPNGQPCGISVAISDDVFNQILYTVYRSGMISFTQNDVFDACDTLLYAIIPEICDTFQTTPGDPLMLDVTVWPDLPPVMVLQPVTGKSGTLETQIQIGDMMVYIMADDASAPGGQRPVLSLSISAILPTNIEHIFETNSLLVEFGTPIVFVDTVNNPAMLSESLFEDLAPLLVELIMPILTQAIEGITLPTFDVGTDTYRMQINDIFYIGSNGDFVGLFGDLEDTAVPADK